jgi:hypothetical protein
MSQSLGWTRRRKRKLEKIKYYKEKAPFERLGLLIIMNKKFVVDTEFCGSINLDSLINKLKDKVADGGGDPKKITTKNITVGVHADYRWDDDEDDYVAGLPKVYLEYEV